MQLIFDQSVYIIEHQLKEHLIEKPEVHLKKKFSSSPGCLYIDLTCNIQGFFQVHYKDADWRYDKCKNIDENTWNIFASCFLTQMNSLQVIYSLSFGFVKITILE